MSGTKIDQGLISVVIPVYRNADTLGELHTRLSSMLREVGAAYELIFVNDACPDGSGDILKSIAARDERVVVVEMSHNVGQNSALFVGLQHTHGARVVAMDADLQDSPETVPLLLEKLAGSAAVIFAARRGRYHANFVDQLTSQIFKWLRRLLSRGSVPLDVGLFLAMNRTMADRIVTEGEGWPYLIGFMARTGLQFTSIPVERMPRPVGRSAYSTWQRMPLAARALLYSYTPLASRWQRQRPASVATRYQGAAVSHGDLLHQDEERHEDIQKQS